MYRAVQKNGDCVQVPQLVFTKLTAPGATEMRFRVALYALSQTTVTAQDTAQALHLRTHEVERALDFWEGAGLLERVETASPEVTAGPRTRLTTPETTAAAKQDGVLAGLLTEIQRIFGGVVSQADHNVFSTLYIQDRVPADLILLAASYCAAQGKPNARYIEKLLLSWRRDGIDTCQRADAHLRVLAQRAERESEVAATLGLPAGSLTLAERRKIATWYEDFGYNVQMLQAARLVAGDKDKNISYLHGILRKWHGKGYTRPQDVQQSGENRNIRVQGSAATIAPEDDLLLNAPVYLPLHSRKEAP